MKIRRKFNLGRIGHQYESIEIEVDGEDLTDLLTRIELAWRGFNEAITAGKVQ